MHASILPLILLLPTFATPLPQPRRPPSIDLANVSNIVLAPELASAEKDWQDLDTNRLVGRGGGTFGRRSYPSLVNPKWAVWQNETEAAASSSIAAAKALATKQTKLTTPTTPQATTTKTTQAKPSETSASTSTGYSLRGIQKNGIYVGLLPDDGSGGGKSTNMAALNSALGMQGAAQGWYAQAQNGVAFDGAQLLARLNDVKASGGVFQPAVMPTGGWGGLTAKDNSQAVNICNVMKKFTDEGIEVWLRFAHEVNYYQTDGTYTGNAADFKAGWAAVAAACKYIAPEVKMWFTPNVAEDWQYDEYFPDDHSTVDLIGIDWYPQDAGTSFVDGVQSFHDKYTSSTIKFAQGETGLAQEGSLGERIQWLTTMTSAATASALPNLICISYWVQDTLLERARRQQEAQESTRTVGRSVTAIFWRVVDSGQSWFVVSLVGAIIGLNAALMSIITVWLSDLKLGYCTQGWWLNRKFCCWEMEELLNEAGGCEDWNTWTSFVGIQWLFYVAFAGLFAFVCAFLVKSYAPYAAGSGISEIKCILAGFVIKGFLSFSTLAIKSVALPISIASGLSVGKEGPSVHVASSIGHVVASCFGRFSRSQAKMREIVTAASAAGVAVAFGSPIGGVLFSLEEMTLNFPIKTMWRSFFCALVATVVLSAMNPFRTGKLVLFQVHFDRDWHFFEVGFFILIGVFGGLYGAFVIKYNLQVAAFRRKHLGSSGITEAVCLAVLTASVGYVNKFLRIDMNESLDILFRECEGGGDYENLCQCVLVGAFTVRGEANRKLDRTWAQWRMVNSLLLATVLRTALVVISYGCKVPAGIFVPSMAVGATFGRMVGILVKALYRQVPDPSTKSTCKLIVLLVLSAYPTWSMFAACDPEKPCITPGTYAFLGAAAGLAGITRITVTVVVIMFELTGALTYILPTMIVVMVTKAVSDQFGKGGIADQMIRFNGFPFLENEDHAYNVPVSVVMRRNIVYLPSSGMRLFELESLLVKTSYQGFPVVRSRTDVTLLGDISRADLRIAIDKAELAQLVSPDAPCLFCPEDPVSPESPANEFDDIESTSIDFTSYVNQTPLTVSPKQPLEIVMQIFKRMGPRVILIEQFGLLVGLITVKDCLKYTLAHEAQSGQSLSGSDEVEQTLEDLRTWAGELWEGIVDRVKGRDPALRLHSEDDGTDLDELRRPG
ncbi:chloride channel 3/4/5, partial [Phenoliferia sp. Uapishka_3]